MRMNNYSNVVDNVYIPQEKNVTMRFTNNNNIGQGGEKMML